MNTVFKTLTMMVDQQETISRRAKPMECYLCTVWKSMPFAKRWSTPTTPRQTEEAMVIGFWAGIRRGLETEATLCENHKRIVGILDKEAEKRTAPTIPAPPPVVVSTPVPPPSWGSGTITPYPPTPISEPPGKDRISFPFDPNPTHPANPPVIVCPVCKQAVIQGQVHMCPDEEPAVERFGIHSQIDPLPGESGYPNPSPK